MKQQSSFADMKYSARRKVTQREKFLADLDRSVPWLALVGLIELHDCRGERGRYCRQHHGSRFVGIGLIERQAPEPPRC